MPPETSRPTGDQVLAKLHADRHARLRIYIGAAPGVGKTYSMIDDAHAFRREGLDIVIGFVETHGRADTEARIGDLEIIPRRRFEYRGVVARRNGRRRDSRAEARALRGRRARPYQRARQPPREALSGRCRAARGGHRRHDRRQHPAPRNAERRRQPRHGGPGARDRAGHVSRSRRRDRQRRRDGGGAAHPPAAGQGLQAGEGRAGAVELLPRNQHLDAARARVARRRRRDRRKGGVTPAAGRASNRR